MSKLNGPFHSGGMEIGIGLPSAASFKVTKDIFVIKETIESSTHGLISFTSSTNGPCKTSIALPLCALPTIFSGSSMTTRATSAMPIFILSRSSIARSTPDKLASINEALPSRPKFHALVEERINSSSSSASIPEIVTCGSCAYIIAWSD